MRGIVKHGSTSLSSTSKRLHRPLIPSLRSESAPCAVANPLASSSSTSVRLGRRYQSNTSSRWAISSFFSRRPPPPNSQGDAVEDFREAISSRDVEGLRRAYDPLSSSSADLSPSDIEAALAFLSSSRTVRSQGAYKLFRRIYDDLPSRWGVPHGEKHHRLLISALLGIGRPKLAATTARDLELRDAKMWRDILKSSIPVEPSSVDEIWDMLASAIPVGPPEYTILLSHLHINVSDASEIKERLSAILRDLRARKEWIGTLGEAELVYVHCKLGELGKAQTIVDAWDPKKDTMVMWNAAAELEMAKVNSGASEGAAGVEEVVRGMLEKRIKPIQRVVTFLVLQELSVQRDSRSEMGLEDVLRIVDKVEGMCKNRASSAVWSEIIYTLSRGGGLDVALEVYQEVKSRGVEISSTMARNLIRPLCFKDPPDLMRSMAVYADWSASPLDLRTSRDRERALDVFIPLLKACAATPGAGGTVIRLLSDLRSRGLPLPSNAAVSLAISLMRQSSDHGAAFNIYAHFYALNSTALTSHDYDALLAAFLSLQTSASAYAPPHLYLEIVKDMKRAGHPPSSHVISALLQSYAQQATRIRRSSSDPDIISSRFRGLEKSVTELHTVLKLDPLVEVDVPLLSALMDAYNRLGEWGSAFEVWADLVERRPREDPERTKELYGPAISVVLDTCGRSDQLVRGRRIWAWTERHGLRNGKHYESWVEALCRLGQMGEALDVVRSMERGDGRIDAIEVLARFSMEDTEEGGKRLREGLEDEFPGDWVQVRQRLARADFRDGVEDLDD